jgi:hypothetical protein
MALLFLKVSLLSPLGGSLQTRSVPIHPFTTLQTVSAILVPYTLSLSNGKIPLILIPLFIYRQHASYLFKHPSPQLPQLSKPYYETRQTRNSVKYISDRKYKSNKASIKRDLPLQDYPHVILKRMPKQRLVPFLHLYSF